MTPSEIAKGLSKAQREALLACEWRGSGPQQFAVVNCTDNLTNPLTEMLTLRWDKLTQLGHEVRRAIIEQESRDE